MKNYFYLVVFLGTFFGKILVHPIDLANDLKKLQQRLGLLKGNLAKLRNNLGDLRSKLTGSDDMDIDLPSVGSKSKSKRKRDEFTGSDDDIATKKSRSISKLEQELKEYAEDQGYGYKTGNLILLNTLCAAISEEMKNRSINYQVDVPIFKGISDEKVKLFLKSKNLNIEKKWEEIVNRHYPNYNDRKSALSNGSLTEGFWQDLGNLEQDINNSFKTIGKTNFSFDQSFKEEGIDTVISTVSGQNNKLMIRSTGKEDTDKLSNAGGNESVANVLPTNKDVLEKMGIVVASYVSQKSLKQRLDSGDTTVFDVPFIPVLIQRMIGENTQASSNDYEQIPVCGVMFTEEAEGGISKLQPRDKDGVLLADSDLERVKTSGITLVQASYGHNEGVVNSIVAVDSYFISNEDEFYPIIKPKNFRLVPSTIPGELTRQDNPNILAHASALASAKVIKAFKILANKLEKFYKKPMDVEYVIDRKTKTIFIVQARPIVHPKNSKKASYIAKLEEIDNEKIAKVHAIGIAGGAVRVLSGRKNYIIKDGIGEALTEYLAMTPDQKKEIECIITKYMAPATSHEATSFRTFLKPVVYAEDNFKKISDWVNTDKKLLVDVQQEVVIQASEILDDQNELPGAFIATGNKNYPAPELISLLEISGDKNKDVNKESILNRVKDFLENLEPSKEKRNSLFDAVNKIPKEEQGIKQFFTKLESKDASVAREALFKLVYFATRRLLGLKDDNYYDIKLLQEISVFVDYLIKISLRVNSYLFLEKGDQLYQRKLLALRYLRALFYQQVAPKNVLGASSFSVLFKTIREEMKTLKEFGNDLKSINGKDLKAKVIQLLRAGEVAFSDDLRNKWNSFVFQAVQDGEQNLNKLAQCVSMLSSLDLLGTWMVTSVGKDGVIMQKLLKEYEDAKSFLEQLDKINYDINIFDIALWEDPKKFESQLNALQKFIDYFSSNDFKQESNKNLITNIAAAKIMEIFVDFYDLSLKLLKSSNKYAFDDKPAYFKVLLGGYAKLIIEWMEYGGFELNDSDLKLHKIKQVAELNDPGRLLSDRITKVRASYQYDQQMKENLLNPSEDFVLSVVVLGSAASFAVGELPSTYEDIFTFCHQSLLVIISRYIKRKIEVPNNALPEIFLSFADKFKSKDFTDPFYSRKVELVGVEINIGHITYKYNYLLRSHSATITLSYDKKENQVRCGCSMFGENEWSRWDKIADFIEAVSVASKIKYNVRLEQKNVFFEWTIRDNKHLDQIINFIETAGGTLSYATDSKGEVVQQENKAYDAHEAILSKRETLEGLIDLSLGTKGRVHWYLPKILEKEINNLTSDYIDKVIRIIEKLCDDNNLEYALATELFDFKIVHSPAKAYLETMGKHYYNLKPTIKGFYHKILENEKNTLWGTGSDNNKLKTFYRKTARQLVEIVSKRTSLTTIQKKKLNDLKVKADQGYSFTLPPSPTQDLD